MHTHWEPATLTAAPGDLIILGVAGTAVCLYAAVTPGALL